MKRVTVLMYHQVGLFPPMKTHRATYCHVNSFRRQMAYLHHGGYSVISLAEAMEGLYNGKSLPPRAIALTFDDGYENFYEHAAPVLAQYQFPATVYLLSGKVGGKADWLLADGHEAAPLMNSRQIRDLQDSGISFGSHGRTHRRLSTLTPVEIADEIARSKTELEDLLEKPVTTFCYPYGDYNAEAVQSVEEAGYSAALSCIRGRANSSDSPLELPRLAVSYGTSLAGFFWKLHLQRR